MSGSGGDTGYDYQANAVAFVSAHALAGQPLAWFDNPKDVPASWLVETGGPGDDLQIIFADAFPIEVQVKHGLQRGEAYDSAPQKLTRGLQNAANLRAVLLVNRHASQIIRGDLKDDMVRLGQGRTDGIKTITRELLSQLNVDARTIPTSSPDFGSSSSIWTRAQMGSLPLKRFCRESWILATARRHTSYWVKRAHGLIKTRGRDDVYKCAR